MALELLAECIDFVSIATRIDLKGAHMRLARALEEKLMDVRLRDKLIAEGKITREQVKDYLQKIEDAQKNATFTEGDEDAE